VPQVFFDQVGFLVMSWTSWLKKASSHGILLSNFMHFTSKDDNYDHGILGTIRGFVSQDSKRVVSMRLILLHFPQKTFQEFGLDMTLINKTQCDREICKFSK
jgi:hypothetical protein